MPGNDASPSDFHKKPPLNNYRTCSRKVHQVNPCGLDSRGMHMTTPNPMQSLLRRHLGVDAFALDGDDTAVLDSWADKPRKIDVKALEAKR